MAGLRELHKEKRRHAICASAIKLFAAYGYERTTVSSIAADANVSPATVFNYFKTKSDILLEAIDAADQLAFVEIGNNRSNWHDPVQALVELDRFITLFECNVLPVNVWREVLPSWIIAPPTQLIALNEKIINLTTDVLTTLRDEELIKPEADISFTANFLNSYASARFWKEIQNGDFCIDNHVEHMTLAITMLINGIRA